MVARKVVVYLKPNSLAEFTELMECEIVPWLRKQEGFLGLTILPVAEGSEVATISFWDHKWNVQAYNSRGYPDVLKTLANTFGWGFVLLRRLTLPARHYRETPFHSHQSKSGPTHRSWA